jgi:hypothetical protein
MISILNSIFSLCYTQRDEQNKIIREVQWGVIQFSDRRR